MYMVIYGGPERTWCKYIFTHYSNLKTHLTKSLWHLTNIVMDGELYYHPAILLYEYEMDEMLGPIAGGIPFEML